MFGSSCDENNPAQTNMQFKPLVLLARQQRPTVSMSRHSEKSIRFKSAELAT